MQSKLLAKNVQTDVMTTVVKATSRQAMVLEKLIQQLITAKTYQPETTHQIRILSNKITAALRVLGIAGIDLKSKELKKILHRLRRSLGLLRDADIRLSELHSFSRKRKIVSGDALSGAVHYSWSLCYLKSMPQLRKDWPAYRKSLRNLCSQCKYWLAQDKEYPWKKRHRRQVCKQLVKWSRHAEKMNENEKEFHSFRLQTKRLRYLLQCLLPQKVETTQRGLLSLLEQLQQELGRYCDLKNVLAWLDSLQNSFMSIQRKPTRLVSSLSVWRRNCEAELRRNEKQLFNLSTKVAHSVK